MYSLFETTEFIKAIERLSAKDSDLVKKKLSGYIYPQLRQEPHFGLNIKKLKNYTPDTWRYRIGRYRIFYSIDEKDDLVFLITLDQRKDAYK